jgi:LCP family protein required for cell wall assembly
LWLTFLRRFGISCGVVLLVSSIAVQFGNTVEQRTFNATRKIHIPTGVLTVQPPGKPANYLLIGVDSRLATDAGSNSDVMMVLHVEPATHTSFLVSFPRDLIVNIPGHGRDLLNAAYAIGGPALTIQTFQQDFAPLTIQHYIEVDFAGFQAIVDAIGHVNIWFPTPVHDPYIGIDVEHAGCVAMNGLDALHYERSRHYYVPDNLQNPAPWTWNYPAQSGGQGWSANGSDTERIPRQQYLLRTIAQAALNKTASDPTKLFGLLDAVQHNFAHDDTLTLNDLKSLIRAFNGLDPTKVEMTTLPNIPGGANNFHLLVKYPDATPIIDRLASLPPPPTYIPTAALPSHVRVRVVNGTGEKGLAAQVLNEFLAAGFKSGGPPADADRSDYAQTQVRYAPGHGSAGVTAVIATGTNHFSEALSLKDTLGGDVLVVVGRDWNKLHHHFPTPTTTTQPAGVAAPTSTTASTTTTTTTVPKTTTTLDPYLPVDPKTGGPLTGCPKI